MGGGAASFFQLWEYGGEVVLVPSIVRVGKSEVEGTVQGGNDLVNVAETGLDGFRKSGLFKILQGPAVSPCVDLVSELRDSPLRPRRCVLRFQTRPLVHKEGGD